jgi:hypothetical protein
MYQFKYLTFSDSAKYAEAAKNLLSTGHLTINHSFFSPAKLDLYSSGNSFAAGFLPLPSYFLSLVFRFFPVSDQTVIAAGLCLFVILGLLTYLLTYKLTHSSFESLFAGILVLTNPYLIEYGLNASSEIFFSIELVLLLIFFYSKRLFILFFIPLLLLFLTRQQATIVLISLIFYLASNFLINKRFSFKLKVFAILFVVALFPIAFKLSRLTDTSSFSPGKAFGSIYLPNNIPPSNYLRGNYYTLNFAQIVSKAFYNLYNFLKFPERIIAPEIIFLFFISLFFKLPQALKKFRLFSFILFFAFLFAASLTLPNARYLHPLLPLIVILSTISLFEISSLLSPNIKKVFLTICLLYFVFPTFTTFTLDRRSDKSTLNINKPPAYKVIADYMSTKIPTGHLIITNLDAWAAWYHGLTTMWFPYTPSLLSDYVDKVDYIVITDYLSDNSDFYLNDWQQILDSPTKISDPLLNKNFRLLTTFTISSDQTLERQIVHGTILVNKNISK